jgi:hypothetical protein
LSAMLIIPRPCVPFQYATNTRIAVLHSRDPAWALA